MAEFSSIANLEVQVDESSLKQVNRDIERGVSDPSVSVSSSVPDGGQRMGGTRGQSAGILDATRKSFEVLQDLVDLAEERNDLLENVETGGGGIGPGGGFGLGLGLRSLVGGSFGLPTVASSAGIGNLATLLRRGGGTSLAGLTQVPSSPEPGQAGQNIDRFTDQLFRLIRNNTGPSQDVERTFQEAQQNRLNVIVDMNMDFGDFGTQQLEGDFRRVVLNQRAEFERVMRNYLENQLGIESSRLPRNLASTGGE